MQNGENNITSLRESKATEAILGRQNLIDELNHYNTTDDEKSFIPRFLDLLKSNRCFYRDHFDPGHITASAILLNKDGDQILMNHHKSLNKWLNFGGHCDGEEDVLAVAIRETMEESGITAFKPLSPNIIDIDIHDIPANDKKSEPAHAHFDIRYVMQMTGDQNPVLSDESNALQWMTIEDALDVSDSSLSRFIKKAYEI
jgi:8-oxo-dGTP pyrophosphatase MutT (NUDIX family)